MKHLAPDLAAWQKRWQGMDAIMKDWLALYRRPADASQPADLPAYLRHNEDAQTTLITLVESLQAFGKSQVDFFSDGFNLHSAYRLEPSLEYSPEYALRVTVEQIGHDMEVLMRAYAQRAIQVGNDDLRQTLAEADKLTYAALQPARQQKLIDPDVTAITYFQKSVNVRLTPYAPVVLVGIPFSAVGSKRDLLMIPHEVGHYVFREGRARSGRYTNVRLTAALHNRSLQPPAWLLPWLEEIFADVYGCLIGGPVMALSSQDMVMEYTLAQFMEDDEEHPTPLLRPDIYLAVLKQMGGYDGAIAKLRQRWEQCLDERGRPTEFRLANGTPIALESARQEMTAVVQTILEDYLHDVWKSERNEWSDTLAPGEEAEDLYTKFEQKRNRLIERAARIPMLAATESKTLVLNGDAAGRLRRLGNTELWFDAIKESARRAAKGEGEGEIFNVPAEVWRVLLDAGGWATEGPGGGFAH